MEFRKEVPTEFGVYHARHYQEDVIAVVSKGFPNRPFTIYSLDGTCSYTNSFCLTWGDRIDLDRTLVPEEVAKCCRELRTYLNQHKLAPWLANLTAKICDWVDSLTPPREEPQPDPNSLPADEVERIHKLLDGHVPRADGTTCDDSGCQSKLYHRVHLLLEKSPQPVPEHVKATIGNLRSLMSKGEPCGYWYVQVLCDHILPREEPQPLPLPEQRRGTYEGVPCVASKSIHNDRTWWVQFRTKDGYPTDQLLTENCRELKLDGAADA